jgi:hypothetical protein
MIPMEELDSESQSLKVEGDRDEGEDKIRGEDDEEVPFSNSSSSVEKRKMAAQREVLRWWRESRAWRWMFVMVVSMLTTRSTLRSGFCGSALLLFY